MQSCLLKQIASLGDKVVITHVLAWHMRGTEGACNERTLSGQTIRLSSHVICERGTDSN